MMTSRKSIFDKSLVLIFLKALINSVTKFFSSSLSGLQKVDLVSFYFISFFLPFFFYLFSFVLFLAPRVRVSGDIGHIAQRRF